MAEWSLPNLDCPINQFDSYHYATYPSSRQHESAPRVSHCLPPQAQLCLPVSSAANMAMHFAPQLLYGPAAAMVPLGENPREVRNRAEKMRRDRLNRSVAELASMVPPVVAARRKADKTTVLRLTAHYLRAHQYVFGNSIGSSEQEFNPASMLKVMSLFNGFLITTTYRGIIVVVSQNINQYLGYTELDLLGQNLLTLTHEADRHILREQLMPKTQTLGPNGELLFPDGPDATRKVEQALAQEKRRFTIRLKKLGQRSEPTQYVMCHVEGSLRKSDRACSSPNRNCCQIVRRARARTENPCSSGNDIVFIGMVRPATETFINESALESYRMEYRTRHSIDGGIIQCESRISLVTGYMTDEVSGVNALNFIHRDDVRWVIIALREMYDEHRLVGESCYRLITRNGQFVYMRTRGCLDVDQETKAVTSFVCTNTVVNKTEGKHLIKLMKRKFMLLVNNNEAPAIEDIDDDNHEEEQDANPAAPEDPRRLEQVILHLVTNLPSPPPQENDKDYPAASPDKSASPQRLTIIPPNRERIVSAIDKVYGVIKTFHKDSNHKGNEHAQNNNPGPSTSASPRYNTVINYNTAPCLSTPPRLNMALSLNTAADLNAAPNLNTVVGLNAASGLNTAVGLNAVPSLNTVVGLNSAPSHNTVIGLNGAPSFNTAVGLNAVPSLNTVVGLNSATSHNTVIGLNGAPSLNTAIGLNGAPNPNTAIGLNGAHSLNTAIGLNGAPSLNAAIGLNGAPRLNTAIGLNGAHSLNTAIGLNGAPSLNTVVGLNSATSHNTVIGLNGAPSLNTAIGLNGAPNLNTAIGLNGAHSLNTGIGLNGAPSLNAAIGLNGAPRLNTAIGLNGAHNLNTAIGLNGAPSLNTAIGRNATSSLDTVVGLNAAPSLNTAVGLNGAPSLNTAACFNTVLNLDTASCFNAAPYLNTVPYHNTSKYEPIMGMNMITPPQESVQIVPYQAHVSNYVDFPETIVASNPFDLPDSVYDSETLLNAVASPDMGYFDESPDSCSNISSFFTTFNQDSGDSVNDLVDDKQYHTTETAMAVPFSQFLEDSGALHDSPQPSASHFPCGTKRPNDFEESFNIVHKKKITGSELANCRQNDQSNDYESPLDHLFDEAVLNSEQIESAINSLESLDPSFPDLLVSTDVQDFLGQIEKEAEEEERQRKFNFAEYE